MLFHCIYHYRHILAVTEYEMICFLVYIMHVLKSLSSLMMLHLDSGFLSKVRARVRLTLTLFVIQVLEGYHLIFFSSIYYQSKCTNACFDMKMCSPPLTEVWQLLITCLTAAAYIVILAEGKSHFGHTGLGHTGLDVIFSRIVDCGSEVKDFDRPAPCIWTIKMSFMFISFYCWKPEEGRFVAVFLFMTCHLRIYDFIDSLYMYLSHRCL